MSHESRKFPLGLENFGQNVCFFNSVIQVLYSVKSFREFVYQFETNIGNSGKLAIKDLFSSITSSALPIIPSFDLGPSYNEYNHSRFQQFDAHECVTYILNQIFASQQNSSSGESIFKTTSIQSILCQSCSTASEMNVFDQIFSIEFTDRFNHNSIENEISRLVSDPHGELLESLYNCENCLTQTRATKCKQLLTYLTISLYHWFYFAMIVLQTLRENLSLTYTLKILLKMYC
eukprot:TCONS_00038250-protein